MLLQITRLGAFISIHALRKESDPDDDKVSNELRISIHALRKESDRRLWRPPSRRAHFNPRSP